jgi:flagella basal body P-ring formation protein FlgA
MKILKRITPLAIAILAGATASLAGEPELILPPPPVSAQPPAVDLTVLAELRAARLPAGPTIEAAAIPIRLNLAAAPSDASLKGILQNVGGQADSRRLLETKLFDQLRQDLPGSEEYVLDQATIPESIELPKGAWTVDYNFRLPAAGIGHATYSATLRELASGEAQRFSGTVAIDRESSGVTVTRVVRNGEILREGDVQTLKARLSQLPRGAFDSADLAVGAKARREIRPGEWLTDQHIGVPDMVKRGQGVLMRLVHGPMTISAPGIAAQSGGRGQIIRVQNASTKKEIFAKIVSKEEVQVMN